MPITPAFEWSETETTLEVRVQIQGAAQAKASVFATDCMVKINCSPYLLVIDLKSEVDDSRSSATLSAQGVVFKMVKTEPGLWSRLEAVGNREELSKRREDSVDRAHQKMEAARLQRLERKQREEKEATDRQIELERRKRRELEARKAAELLAEREKISDWQKKVNKPQGDESDYEDDEEGEEEGQGRAAAQEAKASSSKAAEMPDHPDYHGRGYWSKDKEREASGQPQSQDQSKVPNRESLIYDSDEDEGSGVEEKGAGESSDDDQPSSDQIPAKPITFKPLPPPRIRLEPVRVEFTKLATGHLPARENREEEMKQYKKKENREEEMKQYKKKENREEEIKQYKKKLVDEKLLADSNDISDRQPVFLKDKGDGLYKQGNYRGAINAYTRAIELDNEVPLYWSNRAACQLQLEQWSDCISDCSQALDLLNLRKASFSLSSGPTVSTIALKPWTC
eukprot:gene2202-33760_t